MKAQVLYGINDMRYEDIEEPQLKDGWVIVKVMAAGICGSDIPRIYKTGAHVHPIVIGHEFSGKVVKTYNGDSDWYGKRVGVFPLIPCGNVNAVRISVMRCAVIIIIWDHVVMADLLSMWRYQSGIFLSLRRIFLTGRRRCLSYGSSSTCDASVHYKRRNQCMCYWSRNYWHAACYAS